MQSFSGLVCRGRNGGESEKENLFGVSSSGESFKFSFSVSVAPQTNRGSLVGLRTAEEGEEDVDQRAAERALHRPR